MEKKPASFFTKKGKKAVLLFHAYSGSPNDVRMLSRALEKENYTVYAPLFLGHGTMEPKEILMTDFKRWEEDAENAFSTLVKEGFEEIAVFGLSMGGIFAMDLLTKGYPEIVAGGAFCSPLFKTENNVEENFLLYAKQIYQRQKISGDILAAKLSELRPLVNKQLQNIEALGARVSQNLSSVQVPVYLAQGGADEMIDAKTAYKTAAALRQVDVTLDWYAQSGHVITVDPVHQQFEKDVIHFLTKLNEKR
ncbi:alpha/beta fold hydrolase [Enterococcus sp. MJM12]|uniref:Alpha/beta fold hydrolase n=1 Tax=Candidatus Enterococcus myersii TaxID=2815322 RepID=A0ABS3HBL8_9ENTE|nr:MULTISPECIES: alpha/beta fold hydrolase [Enterococcus]MBO0450300.1 alpha/beta fold hydrolase [Enterococcus sp. MJM12]MCD1023957.1 alpha/beta fold hydrolase [Enterococcus sp. SMC-9]WHA10060.1 alpha/beta fold hydrolase [Enterococcus montenegrensis]